MMTELNSVDTHTEDAPLCSTGASNMKCAVVSWIMPLIAAGVLWLGLYFPVMHIFNIIFVAFGLMALARSLIHIYRYGSCGLGGHVVAGLLLNLAVLVLIGLNIVIGLKQYIG